MGLCSSIKSIFLPVCSDLKYKPTYPFLYDYIDYEHSNPFSDKQFCYLLDRRLVDVGKDINFNPSILNNNIKLQQELMDFVRDKKYKEAENIILNHKD